MQLDAQIAHSSQAAVLMDTFWIAEAASWADSCAGVWLCAGAERMTKLELQCPALNTESSKLPQIPRAPVAVKPQHSPIAAMLRENVAAAATAAAQAREQSWKRDQPSCAIPPVFRSQAA